MTLEILRELLGWCFVLNLVLLSSWFLMITFGGKAIYRIHSRMIPVSEEHFNAIHYAGISAYKVFVFATNLVPYLALRIIA